MNEDIPEEFRDYIDELKYRIRTEADAGGDEITTVSDRESLDFVEIYFRKTGFVTERKGNHLVIAW